jgi:predicted hydrocarbon binding protein
MAALHERLVFDTARGAVLDADRRYVVLRADVLMGLFASLDGDARERALEAFGRSAREHGAGSVRAYRDAAGADALAPMMEAAAASLGWGHWHFEAARLKGASPSLVLTVENSPFAAHAPPHTDRACHAIAGMLEALGDALWSRTTAARETQCAASGAAQCRFVVAPRDAGSNDCTEPSPARRLTRPGDFA